MVKITLVLTFHDEIDTFQYLNKANLPYFDKLISKERKAMKSIQILHYSLFGYILYLYLNYYFLRKTVRNTNILQGHKINYNYKSSTYFIIKSKFLTVEKMDLYLKDIRFRSEKSEVIIIGSHIDYEELFKNHYRVFGVIDTTNNKSLTFIRDQVHFYLDGLYGQGKIETD
ncbi:hypothetical protein [Streptococcus sp. E17BB]|uniref:hypothetical protein n=1 Tax=Streptococcus sp. E17BB TaxID=3278714 RepID=UPI00359D0782